MNTDIFGLVRAWACRIILMRWQWLKSTTSPWDIMLTQTARVSPSILDFAVIWTHIRRNLGKMLSKARKRFKELGCDGGVFVIILGVIVSLSWIFWLRHNFTRDIYFIDIYCFQSVFLPYSRENFLRLLTDFQWKLSVERISQWKN